MRTKKKYLESVIIVAISNFYKPVKGMYGATSQVYLLAQFSFYCLLSDTGIKFYTVGVFQEWHQPNGNNIAVTKSLVSKDVTEKYNLRLLPRIGRLASCVFTPGLPLWVASLLCFCLRLADHAFNLLASGLLLTIIWFFGAIYLHAY